MLNGKLRHLGRRLRPSVASTDYEHDLQRRMFWVGVWFLLAIAPISIVLTLLYNNRPLAWLAISIQFLPLSIAAIWVRKRDKKRDIVWALRWLHGGQFFGLLILALDNISVSTPFFWWMSIVPFVALLSGLTWLGIATGVICIAYAGLAYITPDTDPPIEAGSLRMHIAVALSMTYAVAYLGLATLWRQRLQLALTHARHEATQAATAKARFLANMSHEIRTPLYGVIGAVELLRSPKATPAQRAQLLLMQEQSAKTLLVLINDVLDWSKLDAGKVAISKESQDIRSLIFESNELFAVTAFDKNIELTSSCDPDVPRKLLGDGVRIRQIVNNLVSNAVKFTKRGGVHIHVSVSPTDEVDPLQRDDGYCWVRMEVSDTGIGIAPELLDTLFKPFTQTDPTVALRYGGTGLGLSISKELATLMGGRIEVSSAVDQGSTFSLMLPLMAIPDEATRPAEPPFRNDTLFVCSNPGLVRHLMSLCNDLRVEPEVVSALPPEHQLGRVKNVLVDSRMLVGRSNSKQWLESVGRLGVKVAVMAPLDADSVVGTFADGVIYKPISKRALAELLSNDLKSAASGGTSYGTPDLTGYRILVAEDNSVNQIIVQKMVEETGALCVVASDGFEALESMKEQPFAMVLMDMNMPVMDGMEASRQWRLNEKSGTTRWLNRLPIIAMTANVQSDLGDVCREAGMDGFITKPFTINELATKMEATIKGKT